MNVIHFITLSLTATSPDEQDTQPPHGHGVSTRNKSLTEMGGEEKEQRQEVRDHLIPFRNNFIKHITETQKHTA
jgi:hypothetical protein